MEGIREETGAEIRKVGVRKKASLGLRLTERDFEILSFLYDQKFASLPVLYFRFFDRRASVEEAVPKNFWVTRQRIAVLRQAGFIDSQRAYTDAKALYLITKAGYEILKTRCDLELSREPVRTVDFRYFDHDKRATLCRAALERHGKSKRWFSDRYLRIKKGYPIESGEFCRLPDGIIPDGVFLSSKNEFVALEVEHTPKKRERYVEKRRTYQNLIFRGATGGDKMLHRVIFVSSSDRIGKDLEEIYGRDKEFQVVSFEKLIGSYLGGEALL